MGGGNRSARTGRRPTGHVRLVRQGHSDLGWVAALLVVAVLVAVASVGGPIWDVLVSGRTLFN